jgi:PBP1b-binding outer membrane lipoprotein LpoB
MKYIIAALALAIMLTGCMGTENYYQSQIAYYNAQAQAYQAQAEAQANRPPLAEMVAPDGTRFVVNQTGDMPAPVIRTTQNPIVEGVKTIVNSTPLAIVAGGWTAKEILKNATGDINASGGSSVTSTSNSHNASEIRNADTMDNSDNSLTDSQNQTADPTIVEQPPYNDPIIVEQPPYNDPIVVEVPVLPEVTE